MGKIEWAMWANEQAVISAIAIIIGGIAGVAAKFHFWQCAAISIPVSVLILWLEWPRSKRSSGTTIERKFQHILIPLHTKLGVLVKNYYVRFGLYLALSIPCCFLLPTFMGALCLQVAAIIYLVAAINKEEWKPTAPPKPTDQPRKAREVVITREPSKPAPRKPGHRPGASSAGDVQLQV